MFVSMCGSTGCAPVCIQGLLMHLGITLGGLSHNPFLMVWELSEQSYLGENGSFGSQAEKSKYIWEGRINHKHLIFCGF